MRTPKGYGYLQGLKSENRKLLLAHRVSWRLHYGSTRGLHVCHRCDNPCCVNPKHLFLGTNADNHKDKANKERAAKGIDNGNAKLTPELVWIVKLKLLGKGYSQREIANWIGVHQGTISHIARGKTWKHV